MSTAQHIVTWWGATTDDFGIPDPFHRYLLVVEEIDPGVWVATGTPLTDSPHPAPVVSVMGADAALAELDRQLADRYGHLKLRRVSRIGANTDPLGAAR